ncbi:helix-turn-helix transcriptional regulator [Hirschia litorea]|uniref:Helix-turn-helix transcriptional regulator n=1 Tax=Hirschia litorea TaxID=1199156 RepID=A0ABW2IK64_9PROT
MPNTIAEETFSFAKKAKECVTVPELARCFQDLIQPYGVVASSAWAVIGGDSKIRRGFGEWPAEWARHYAQNNYFDSDPIFAALLKGHDAGYWDEQLADFPTDEAGERVMADARRFGYADGYSRLVPTLNGSYYLVSLYGQKIDRSPDVRIMFDFASTRFVQEGALLLNRRVGVPLKDHDLTPRQLEVLQYKAEGRTDKEAAELLSISVKAVEGHLTKIRKQLDARSTSQAISIARGKGMISRTIKTK